MTLRSPAAIARNPAEEEHLDSVASFFDGFARDEGRRRRRNRTYYRLVESIHRFLIPEGASVLEIGSGSGDLLAALRPARGLGVDVSDEMTKLARTRHPELEFVTAAAEQFVADEQLDYVDEPRAVREVGVPVDRRPVELRQILRGDRQVRVEDHQQLVAGVSESDMQPGAMQLLNVFGTKFFSAVFSSLLEQPIKDTLYGTKVLRRSDYEAIPRARSYFGDFDPFGDFDLLLGAARQRLRIVDVPVRYAARTYGQTNISRFRHGSLLLQMAAFGFYKLKIKPVRI